MACTDFIQPLNLECLLVNTLSDGNLLIFGALSFLFISFLAARFRMNGEIFFLISAVFGILMWQYLSGIYLLIVLGAGMFIYFVVPRIIKN